MSQQQRRHTPIVKQFHVNNSTLLLKSVSCPFFFFLVKLKTDRNVCTVSLLDNMVFFCGSREICRVYSILIFFVFFWLA